MTEDNRKYNRERLARKANEQQISPGDSVVIRAEGRVSLTSRWDPEWVVTRVKGPVVFLHHQRSGKTKVLNKEKVRIVNPEQHWDDCHPWPKRKQHKPSRYQRQLIRLRDDRPDVQQQNDSDNTAQLRDGPRQLYGRRRRQPHRLNLRAPNQGRNSTSDDLLDTPPDDRLNVQTHRNVDRPLWVRMLSRRAQLAADLSDSDSDIEFLPQIYIYIYIYVIYIYIIIYIYI